MSNMMMDLSLAARGLRKRPVLIAAASTTLALGIGATTAVFSVVWSAWLEPLPYPEADELVRIGDVHERFEPGVLATVSVGNYVDMKEGNRTFESTTLFQYVGTTPEGIDRSLTLLYAEPSLFETLDLAPAFGRALSDAGPRAEEQVVVLSHALWRDAFGGSEDVLGEELVMFGRPWTVIGVAPEDLDFSRGVDAIIPFYWTEEQRNAHGGRSYYAIGRLRSGVSIEAARADLQGIYGGIAARYPESHEGWTVGLGSFREFVVGSDHTALRLMSWAAGLLLLITCVNVASLLMARAESRRKEVAVRAALGAGRGRILTSFLAESLLLGGTGGALGIAVALGGIDVLVSIFGGGLPRAEDIALDGTTLAVALGLTILTSIAVALVPGLDLDLTRPGDVLRQHTKGDGRGRVSVRRFLVVAEVAVAVVLVSGAGLLLNTMWRLSRADLGFEPDGAVAVYLQLPGERYADRGEQAHLYRRLMERLRGQPGIAEVGAGDRVPPDGNITTNGLSAAGRSESVDFVVSRQVTPGYFRAAGIAFVAGSPFAWLPPEEAWSLTELPVVINSRLADALFPEGDAVGGLLEDAGGDREHGHEAGPKRLRVVGVVEAVHQRGATESSQPAIYHPWPAVPLSFQSRPVLLLRAAESTGDAQAAALTSLRRELEAIDPDLRVGGSRSLQDGLGGLYREQQFALSLMSVFAGLALILGLVGIYGVISYTVARRTREVGIRMALGAAHRQVVGRVLGQGVLLSGVGLILGLTVTAGLGRFVDSLLYDVSPVDAPTYAAVGTLFLSVAALASLVPARRASRIEPTEALRSD